MFKQGIKSNFHILLVDYIYIDIPLPFQNESTAIVECL